MEVKLTLPDVLSEHFLVIYNNSDHIIMSNSDPIVSAEVILKSGTGRSLADEGVTITSENVHEFRPRPETITEASALLEHLGFTIPHAGITLTITGKLSQFEQTFQVKLNVRKADVGIAVQTDKEATIPPSISHVIEKVVFVPPPELFS
jgi:subtilase family serine protease